MGKIIREPSRFCDRCGQEGDPAPEDEAQARLKTKINQGKLPITAKLGDHDWLVHCGSNPWCVPKQVANAKTS